MGYYTTHQISIADQNGEHISDEDPKQEEVNRAYKKAYTYNQEETDEALWDNPFDEPCKWHAEEDNSKKVSKEFPEIYIQIDGEGEGSGIYGQVYIVTGNL